MLTLLTNDLEHSAGEIAALYRKRWQIELLFRWIKQHLKIRAFLGRSENAVRLQIFAAMIAFLLLRIAARHSRSASSPCALPIWCEAAYSTADRWPISTSPRPAPDSLALPKTNSISPMLDFPGQPCAKAGIQGAQSGQSPWTPASRG